MRAITIVVTVDDRMGIAFNKRRQSRDERLIENLCQSNDTDIYVSAYSLPLFSEWEDRVKVCDSPLSACPDGGVAFLEMTQISEYIDDISELIIYKWNKMYPSDKKLDICTDACGFILTDACDFPGKSHDIITKEIYRKHP